MALLRVATVAVGAATALGATFLPLSTGLNGNGGLAIETIGNGLVYFGGQFSTAGGVTVNGIAAWDPVAQTWNALQPGPGVQTFDVRALSFNASTLILGGGFSTISGTTIPANLVGEYDVSTGTWHSIGNVDTGNTGGFVRAVQFTAPFLNRIFAGGLFTGATGAPNATNIAQYDGVAWSEVGAGLDNEVHCITLTTSGVAVGGSFSNTADNGVNLNHVGFWTGTLWVALSDGTARGTDGPVHAIIEAPTASGVGTEIYVAGDFFNAGNTPATSIARYNVGLGVWSTVGTGINSFGFINTMALTASKSHLYVGGSFNTAGGNTSHNLAVWDIVAQTWSAVVATNGEGTSAEVKAIAFLGQDPVPDWALLPGRHAERAVCSCPVQRYRISHALCEPLALLIRFHHGSPDADGA